MPLDPETLKRLRAFVAEPTPAMSTKTRREVRNEFEKRFGAKTPTAELVAQIEAAERIVWVPCGYVLFLRQTTCRNCHATERCLDVPQLFLQQRKQGSDVSNPYLYTPVREIEFWSLPRRKIVRVATTPFCLECFECNTSSNLENTQLPTESSLHQQSNVVIQAQNSESSGPQDEDFASPNPSSSSPSTPPEEFAGSPSETDFGSECGEREFAPRVLVEG